MYNDWIECLANVQGFAFRENYMFVCSCAKCVSQTDEPDVTSEEEEDDEEEAEAEGATEGDEMEDEMTDVWFIKKKKKQQRERPHCRPPFDMQPHPSHEAHNNKHNSFTVALTKLYLNLFSPF